MRQTPRLAYSGLTILTNPSRFDLSVGKLITGQAGDYFDICLHPYSRMNCDIRDVKSFANEPFIPGTKAILVLGDEAHNFIKLSGQGTLDDTRGYVFRYNDYPVISSFHHQDAMDRRDYEGDSDEAQSAQGETDADTKGKTKTKRKNYRWWLYHDVKRICQILKNGGEIPKENSWTIEKTPLMETIVGRMRNLEGEEIILDIETTKNFTLTCIGIGILRTREVFVIPWKRYNNCLEYSENDCREIIRTLIVLCARNKLILHNAMFDLFVLAWRYKVLPPKDVFDTMIGWHRLRPECEKSLGHLISYYTFFPYHKNQGILMPQSASQDYQLWDYNAQDIITTGTIYEKMQADIKKYKAEESVQLGNRKVPAYLSLSLRGARLDIEKREKRIKELLQKQEAIDKCLGIVSRKGELNPRSSSQVSNYLYKNLQLPCPNNEEPTKEITLRKLQLTHNIPSLNLILASRGARKSASSLDFIPWGGIQDKGPFDRMTCSWVLTGTDTYRLGSRTLLKKKGEKKSGYGTNFQNWNKNNRDLILADDKKVLIQVDQSGAEALIVSYLCRYGRFRELFLNSIKPHVFVGLHLFKSAWGKRFDSQLIDELVKLPPSLLRAHPRFKEVSDLIKSSDDWPPSERYYFIAKMVCHASNYGAKWPTLQGQILEKSEGQIVLTKQESEQFIRHYHMLFPEIHAWHNDIQQELKNNGRMLRNLFGHPRQFNEPWGESLFKQAYAFKPQSTVGQITNYAIVESFEAIERGEDWTLNIDILQNGHDSVLSQAPEGREMIVAPRIINLLERELVNERGEKFKMRSECQIGKNWKPFHPEKNPLGMKEVKF